MDTIFVQGLEIKTIIGVWEWERRLPQKVLVDLEFGSDTRAAAASDNIDDTLNYKAIADGVIELAGQHFKLVEAFADAIARYILDNYDCDWTRVRVAKPGAIPGSRQVGVLIERSRDA